MNFNLTERTAITASAGLSDSAYVQGEVFRGVDLAKALNRSGRTYSGTSRPIARTISRERAGSSGSSTSASSAGSPRQTGEIITQMSISCDQFWLGAEDIAPTHT